MCDCWPRWMWAGGRAGSGHLPVSLGLGGLGAWAGSELSLDLGSDGIPAEVICGKRARAASDLFAIPVARETTVQPSSGSPSRGGLGQTGTRQSR